MNDRDIRTVLKAELARRYKKDYDTLVLDELGIKHGASRIDLVVVNHRLHGYEIKSDRDSLKRLPDQIKAYSSIMDRMTLVVGYRHAFQALRMVPEWWGVRLAEMKQQSGTVILSDARQARDNPEVDLNAVVALLWRDEALKILEETGEAKGVRSKTRTDIYKRLVEVSKSDYIRARVRQQLKSREGWRADAQRMSCGD
jgi:hypothetical protein